MDPDPVQADDDIPIDAQGDLEKTEAELIRERDLKLVEIADQYPGPGNAQKRVDALNESGVLLKGVAGQWTKRNASNNVRLARERLAKK